MVFSWSFLVFLIFRWGCPGFSCCFFFFFNDTATPEIYTLSLHDALPISGHPVGPDHRRTPHRPQYRRSEEHTSELQSRRDLVCRLLLEKKKKKTQHPVIIHIHKGTWKKLQPSHHR